MRSDGYFPISPFEGPGMPTHLVSTPHSRPRWHIRETLVALLLTLAVLACWLPALAVLADRSVDEGLKRSLLSFAAARGLHGAVSVVQGTELAVQPMGVGLTLTLGQALAPINDLLLQVSDWLLWASVAFGLQKLLLAMGGHVLVSATVTALALLWLALRWRGASPPWLSRLLVVALFARLVMPITLIGSEWLFERFLQQPWQQSQLATESVTARLPGLDALHVPPAAQAPPPGLLDRLKQWATSPIDTTREQLEQIRLMLDQLVERLITLIVVFALQTVVLPLLLAWGVLQVCRGLLAAGAPSR